MKKLMMIAVAVAVLALGVVAISGAAAEEDDGLVGSFLARVAEKLGVSEDQLQTAIDEARTETLDEAVAEGSLTEEQAERLRESDFPFGGPPLHGPGHMMDAAAEVLGMTEADLMEQMQDGNSLAAVAEAQGMSVEDFKAALLNQVQAQLGELVAEGDLTQEQADEIFQRTEENIDDIVSGEGCPRGSGGLRGGPGGFGGPGFGPFSGDGAEITETSDVTA
jgi:polyhydroxyalkanoate synthesis regulator phasin